MAASDAQAFSALLELLHRVDARRLEKSIARDASARAARHQRLRDEMIERLDDLLFAQVVTACDRLRGLHREAADQHREPAEHGLLGIAEIAVAPVEQRLQRLMARMRG